MFIDMHYDWLEVAKEYRDKPFRGVGAYSPPLKGDGSAQTIDCICVCIPLTVYNTHTHTLIYIDTLYKCIKTSEVEYNYRV